ncbi:hypothetical protein [Streptomyces sp. NPDC001750]|uniref:hypothetical protein n=1 Tax=Streptomyces sp. NPDC001750 TaxID=3364607 RepID=UPI0036B8D0A6
MHGLGQTRAGDPLLSKAVAALTTGIESLKGRGEKLRRGRAGRGDIGAFRDVIDNVEGTGRGAGAVIEDQVPSASQLAGPCSCLARPIR